MQNVLFYQKMDLIPVLVPLAQKWDQFVFVSSPFVTFRYFYHFVNIQKESYVTV